MNDRKRILIMLPVLAGAAWLALFGDKTPVGADEAQSLAGSVVASSSAQRVTGDMTGIAPTKEATPTLTLTRESMALALKEEPSNPFKTGEVEAPVSEVVDEESQAPPPAEFIVIGSVIKDGLFNVFLDKDNQTYVASPGAVIDGNRVDAVKRDQVKLFNLSTKTTQIIPIEGDK